MRGRLLKKVFILILNWNSYEDTKKCLDSLKYLDYSNYEIIVIDNGSRDGSAEKIRKEYNEIKLIKNNANLGFAEGNNVGIRYAMERNADYVYLLNNDTIVDTAVLKELVNAAESDPKTGMAGSKIYFMDNPDVISFAGGGINWFRGRIYHIGEDQKDEGQFNKAMEVDYVTGCSLLVKREVIEKVGMMNPEYFRYVEETDWCVRAHRAGYKLIYVPSSILWHKYAASTGGPSPISEYYDARNSLRFFIINSPGGYKIASVFFFFTARIARTVKLIIKYFLGDRRAFRKILAMYLGVFDFLGRKTGECPYNL
jgi:hypothetical protein